MRERRNVTKADLIEALTNIAGYPVPVYTKDGEPWVKLEHANALRNFAKEALGLKDEDPRVKCAICGLIYERQAPKPCPYAPRGGPEGMRPEERQFMKCALDLGDGGRRG